MCFLIAVDKKKCPQGRAGISKFWVADSAAIADLTIDLDEIVQAITVDPTHEQAGFVKVEFEKNTAFFNQEKTKVKSNVNVTQTIQFIEPVMTPALRKALRLMNSCCSVHIIIRDNTGQFHYAGISHYVTDNSWESEDMQTGDGSGNTGADPTSDSNEYTESFVATVNFYAPFYGGGVAAIPIAA